MDLWKFFEERGAKLKDSMFTVVSWLIGFSAAILAFAVKEGFTQGVTRVANPWLVSGLGVIGLLLLLHTRFVIRDYGDHINRTFNRADAARDGEDSPSKIWEAGAKYTTQSLPPVCQHLLRTLGIFAAAFCALIAASVISFLYA